MQDRPTNRNRKLRNVVVSAVTMSDPEVAPNLAAPDGDLKSEVLSLTGISLQLLERFVFYECITIFMIFTL